MSTWYSDFIESIKKEVDKIEIIFRYELGMSILFRKHNIELLSHYENAVDISHLAPREVIQKYSGIFLKKKTFFLMNFRDICEIFRLININYDINLILNHYERDNQELVLAYKNDITKHKKLNKKIAKIAKFIPIKALRKGFFDRYIVDSL